MQEVECLKTYFLLSFLQQNTVRTAVHNKQPAWITEYIKPSNEEM